MAREVTLLADTHSNERVAEKYQRFTEVTRPEIIFVEASLEDDEIRYAETIQNYRTFGNIYDCLDISKSENKAHRELLDTPIYHLDREEFIEVGNPVQKHLNSNWEEHESFQEIPSNEEKKAIYVFKGRKRAFKNPSSTLNLRLGDSAGFIDSEIHSLENKKDREQMFRYGSEKIDKLPNRPKETKRIFEGIYHQKGDLINELESKELTNYLVGCRELLNSYRSTRDQNMADTIESQMKESEAHTGVAAIGSRHLNGVESELPDNWEITQMDLSGSPKDWKIE